MISLRGVFDRVGFHRETTPSGEIARPVRHEVRLSGVVHEAMRTPRGDTFDLVVSLQGEDTLLVWWGRQAIPGLHPGEAVTAWGRPSLYRNRPALLNPMYDLGVTHG